MTIKKSFNSSAINAIEYDTISKILKVTFTSGNTYDYPEVPMSEVEALAAAPSTGKYFNQYIRHYSAK